MALAPVFVPHPPMLARLLSAALSAIAPRSATADVNGIEAFPVEAEVNSGWGDTVIVIVVNAMRMPVADPAQYKTVTFASLRLKLQNVNCSAK
jgi:hypothetical protein